MNHSTTYSEPLLRIGNGYDVHRLASSLPLFLGGIQIPHNKGAVAHSDGDVIIHALCDALLGAAALGDIGHHFPDHDPAYKGIDSKVLLSRTVTLLHNNGYQPVNIDVTLCLQVPKIADFIPQMRSVLSRLLSLSVSVISIKATTTEALGFIGREEGMAAYVVCLIRKRVGIDDLEG